MRTTKTFLIITLSIIAARLAYIAVEGSYNMAIIQMVANPLLTSEQASTVEDLGHKLAALGLSLLLVPILVKFAIRDVSALKKRLVAGVVSSVVIFLAVFVSTYNLQTNLMDKIIKTASPEARYEAYYSILFRQLYIDGSVEDEEFEASSRIGSVLLAMPFAWSHAAELPRRMKESAESVVLDRAQRQAVLERFESDYQAYRDYQASTADFLKRYQRASADAMAKVSSDKYTTANLYGTVIESLHARYAQYKAVNERYQDHQGFMQEANWLTVDLKSLFNSSVNERTWRHQVLMKKVGLGSSGVEVSDWCDSSCPGSTTQLRKIIEEALRNKYSAFAAGVPMGLSLKDFLSSHEAINAALTKLGIIDRPMFSSSPVTFSDFQEKERLLPYGPDISDQLRAFADKTGGSAIPAGLSDAALINSEPYKKFVIDTVGSEIAELPVDMTKGEFFEIWLEKSSAFIESRKSELLPSTPDQMMEGGTVEQGLAAVRMLYIPAVAAIVSAIMVILNTISAIALLIALTDNLRLAKLVSVLLTGGVIFAGIFYEGMPTASMAEVWSVYGKENALLTSLWELFFGIEAFGISVTAGGVNVIDPEKANHVLNMALGWAI